MVYEGSKIFNLNTKDDRIRTAMSVFSFKSNDNRDTTANYYLDMSDDGKLFFIRMDGIVENCVHFKLEIPDCTKYMEIAKYMFALSKSQDQDYKHGLYLRPCKSIILDILALLGVNDEDIADNILMFFDVMKNYAPHYEFVISKVG